MSDEPRKFSDVLLELEGKVDLLLKQVQSNDLVMKILTNKLGQVLEKLDKVGSSAPKSSPFKVDAVDTLPEFKPPMQDFDPSRHTIIQASGPNPNLQQPDAKTGRGRGRPRKEEKSQHLEGDDAFLIKPTPKEPESPFPIQIPKGGKAEIIVPNQTAPTKFPTLTSQISNQEEFTVPNFPESEPKKNTTLIQKVLDKNGKVAFLADVRILNHQSLETVWSGRTSAIGKWAAVVPMGNFRISIRKRDPGSSREVEAVQDVIVDGKQDRVELPTFTMKELDLNKLGGK